MAVAVIVRRGRTRWLDAAAVASVGVRVRVGVGVGVGVGVAVFVRAWVSPSPDIAGSRIPCGSYTAAHHVFQAIAMVTRTASACRKQMLLHPVLLHPGTPKESRHSAAQPTESAGGGPLNKAVILLVILIASQGKIKVEGVDVCVKIRGTRLRQ